MAETWQTRWQHLGTEQASLDAIIDAAIDRTRQATLNLLRRPD